MPALNFRMLRLAREFREASQTSLAKSSGVSQAVISRIESDLREPTEDELDAIAQALDFPSQFFLEGDTPAAVPMFRKRAIRSIATNRMIQARVNTAVLAARRILDTGIEIETQFTFPDPGELAGDPINAARSIRRAWGTPRGRIDDLTGLIEQAGGVVLHADLGSDVVSAAFVSSLGDSRLWFVVNTREYSGERVRLSLAHELGHAVLHRRVPVRDEASQEGEAFTFASQLLLPPDEFDPLVDADLHLRRARDLKRSFWVSIQAIVMTARDRKLISKARYTSLYKQISARGWRLDEPDTLPIEEPGIWPEALKIQQTTHGLSHESLSSIARLSPSDLSALFPRDFRPALRSISGGNDHPPRVQLSNSRPLGSAS
jgi:Zn-dependent peptidase ImmA (M78 family)/transcriptional regulator with XRE-family HTH domain